MANHADGTVTKLRASDGTVLGTFSAPGSPYGVVFDGTNIWVTSGDGFVDQFRVSDGTLLQAIFVGGPTGIAFDGANIWVASTGFNQVSKL